MIAFRSPARVEQIHPLMGATPAGEPGARKSAGGLLALKYRGGLMILTHTEWLAGVILLVTAAVLSVSRSLRKHSAQRTPGRP